MNLPKDILTIIIPYLNGYDDLVNITLISDEFKDIVKKHAECELIKIGYIGNMEQGTVFQIIKEKINIFENAEVEIFIPYEEDIAKRKFEINLSEIKVDKDILEESKNFILVKSDKVKKYSYDFILKPATKDITAAENEFAYEMEYIKNKGFTLIIILLSLIAMLSFMTIFVLMVIKISFYEHDFNEPDSVKDFELSIMLLILSLLASLSYFFENYKYYNIHKMFMFINTFVINAISISLYLLLNTKISLTCMILSSYTSIAMSYAFYKGRWLFII